MSVFVVFVVAVVSSAPGIVAAAVGNATAAVAVAAGDHGETGNDNDCHGVENVDGKNTSDDVGVCNSFLEDTLPVVNLSSLYVLSLFC